MDHELIPADPALVRQRIARAVLTVPAIDAVLGDIILQPHQVDAAARLLALLMEGDGAMLADATGLGKTFVAIALARVFPPALVVVPAALRFMWRDSLGRARVPADVVTYEALSRGGGQHGRPALLILDEAHHARNPKSRRYVALAELAWGSRVLLLSATPVHNRGRDVRALLALFLGSRAYGMSDRALGEYIVRRNAVREPASPVALPEIRAPKWLAIPGNREVLHAITTLPPAVPAADGGTAHTLVTLGLIRAWGSSEHALGETLRRRLRRTAAFMAALESGQRPDRRTLERWPVLDDAIQLGFPLFSSLGEFDVRFREGLDAHAQAVRALRKLLDANAGIADRTRLESLRAVRRDHPGVAIVAFTQFADTAKAMFRGCVADGGVALVTGSGARVASGRVTAEEIVKGFDIGDRSCSGAMPLQLLIATDVLSEGLSLRRAGALVHLDLPWTVARLEQRLGRLRRFGSPHRSIAVYAIGPPVGARELVHVVRALQRKARLSSGIVGTSELETALPLLGARMGRAMGTSGRQYASHGVESIRSLLSDWASGRAIPVSGSRDPGAVAVALVRVGRAFRLVAVIGSRISEDTPDVLDAVRVVSCAAPLEGGELVSVFVPLVQRWADLRRGSLLARAATNTPSPAHAEVLRRLQAMLESAPRNERVSLGDRIEHCRGLVLAAAGAGAELALRDLLDNRGDLSLDVLLQTLEPRVSPRVAHSDVRIVAILGTDEHRKFVGAQMNDE